MLYKFSENHYINPDQVVSIDVRKTENINELRFTFLAGYSKCIPYDSEGLAKKKLLEYVDFCNGYDWWLLA